MKRIFKTLPKIIGLILRDAKWISRYGTWSENETTDDTIQTMHLTLITIIEAAGSILGFHSRDETAILVYRTMAKCFAE